MQLCLESDLRRPAFPRRSSTRFGHVSAEPRGTRVRPRSIGSVAGLAPGNSSFRRVVAAVSARRNVCASRSVGSAKSNDDRRGDGRRTRRTHEASGDVARNAERGGGAYHSPPRDRRVSCPSVRSNVEADANLCLSTWKAAVFNHALCEIGCCFCQLSSGCRRASLLEHDRPDAGPDRVRAVGFIRGRLGSLAAGFRIPCRRGSGSATTEQGFPFAFGKTPHEGSFSVSEVTPRAIRIRRRLARGLGLAACLRFGVVRSAKRRAQAERAEGRTPARHDQSANATRSRLSRRPSRSCWLQSARGKRSPKRFKNSRLCSSSSSHVPKSMRRSSDILAGWR